MRSFNRLRVTSTLGHPRIAHHKMLAFKQGNMEEWDEIHDYVENAAGLVQDGN
jgi:hypothetical protein